MRKTLNNYLIDAVENDDSIIFITGDLGFGVFDEFRAKFPENYINAGIAESNMVAIAAGLSAKGYKPIIYSIASFMTSRPYEFTKILAGYNSRKIVLIGAGGGLSYSMSGSTHHAIDDLGLMLGIPEINVLTPSGPLEMCELLNYALNSQFSSYMRIGKFGEKDLFTTLKLEPQELKKGRDIALLTHSNMTESALEISNRLKNEHDNNISVVHFPLLRPVNWIKFLDEYSDFRHFVIYEEHLPMGGLYTEILRAVSERGIAKKISRFGPPEKFLHENLTQSSNAKRYGYDVESIINFISRINS